MQVQIITPEKIVFEGEADMVVAPGGLGDFGVLPGHAPFISTLKAGVIEVTRAGEPPLKIAVDSGIAEVTPEKCVILTQEAKEGV
jgi:F-type H+-transporting ATPase subunit epsilon